jgi:hypothetical protein
MSKHKKTEKKFNKQYTTTTEKKQNLTHEELEKLTGGKGHPIHVNPTSTPLKPNR